MNSRSYITTALMVVSSIFAFSGSAQAEDWTISAVGSCRTALGSTVESGGGLRASGGTAVVACPLTKEVTGNALQNVWARLKRASATGAKAFCDISYKDWDGDPNVLGYGWSTDTTAAQSVSVAIPTQYTSGYADLYCVLYNNDTLYGVRYKQLN